MYFSWDFGPNLNPDSQTNPPFPSLTVCIALAGKYRDAFAGEDQSGWCSVLLAAFAGFVFVFLVVSVSLSWFCTSLQSSRFQILEAFIHAVVLWNWGESKETSTKCVVVAETGGLFFWYYSWLIYNMVWNGDCCRPIVLGVIC